MGITIHYNGKLDDRARLAELLDAARLYCAEQRWGYREVDERIVGRVERFINSNVPRPEKNPGDDAALARDTADTEWAPIDDSLQGILIMTHPYADPFWLTFNDAGELAYEMPLDDRGAYWEMKSLFARTEHAGAETHMAICELLRMLRAEFMPGLNVYDEGNYFESGDLNQLADDFETVNAGGAYAPSTFENPD